MLKGHLSDEQIQLLAMDSTGNGAAHAANCPDCKTRLENYKLLIQAIEKEEAPAFGFDLAAAVVAEIEASPAKPKTNGLWWLCIITIAVILVAAGIYFGDYMTEFYAGIKSLGFYFIAITSVILVIVLAIAQYKTYQQKFKMLEMQ